MNSATATQGGVLPGILAKPARPGILRICPKCGTWFALRKQAAPSSHAPVRVTTFRCRKCQCDVEFAARPARGSI